MRILIGVIALFVLLPGIGWKCLRAMYKDQKISVFRRALAGKQGKLVHHRTVMISNVPQVDFDTWFHYLRGNFDLVGPQPMLCEEAEKLTAAQHARLMVAPGIVAPFDVKKTTGIAHVSEQEVSVSFAESASLARRFQVIVVWLLQKVLGTKPTTLGHPESFDLFGVRIDNVTMTRALAAVRKSLHKEAREGHATKFAFVNADCANQTFRDVEYKNILNKTDWVFADGVGVKIAARMRGIAVRENVNGTDMFPLLCEHLAEQGRSVYLLGAKPGVVNKMVSKLSATYPGLTIAGYSHGYSDPRNASDLQTRINQSNADLLLVAMGAPRQEHWIDQNIGKLNVKAVIGVGGLFDFYSESVSRAPEWLRELSLEWVWRLAMQPADKFKRYLVGNPLFLFRAMKAADIKPTGRRSLGQRSAGAKS